MQLSTSAQKMHYLFMILSWPSGILFQILACCFRAIRVNAENRTQERTDSFSSNPEPKRKGIGITE